MMETSFEFFIPSTIKHKSDTMKSISSIATTASTTSTAHSSFSVSDFCDTLDALQDQDMTAAAVAIDKKGEEESEDRMPLLKIVPLNDDSFENDSSTADETILSLLDELHLSSGVSFDLHQDIIPPTTLEQRHSSSSIRTGSSRPSQIQYQDTNNLRRASSMQHYHYSSRRRNTMVTRPPNRGHRRERNQAFTAEDFEAKVFSQLDMTR